MREREREREREVAIKIATTSCDALTLSIMTLSITTVSLTAFSLTLSMKGLFLTLRKNDTPHYDIQPNDTRHKGLICDTQEK